MSLKTLIVDNLTVRFECYGDGNLWYVIGDFEFPVPISDTGTGIFMAEDKSILFMRWIRKHMETIEQARSDQEERAGARGHVPSLASYEDYPPRGLQTGPGEDFG